MLTLIIPRKPLPANEGDHLLPAPPLVARDGDAPYQRLRTLLTLAESHRLRGDGAGQAAALAEVATLCVLLSAEPLPICTANPPPPDGLTAREVDVLRLIAQGLSNREIAAALFISSRTVNRHIENLYRKIDARSKADATAYALRHDLA